MAPFADIEEELPLTPAQLGIWLRILRYPESGAAYNLGCYGDIRGPIDWDCYVEAHRTVLASTAALRIQFSDDARERFQRLRVRRAVQAEPQLVDFSKSADPMALAYGWMRSDIERSFSLGTSPLARGALLKIGPERYLDYGTYHHLILDGIGMNLLGIRMGEIYSAVAGGAEVRPSMERHRQYLQGLGRYNSSPNYRADREYWRSLHVNSPPPTTLSARPSKRTSACFPIKSAARLEVFEVVAIDAIATEVQASAVQVLVAMVASFLHRVLGIDEIPLGIPIHGREGEFRRNLIWSCVNVLPVKLRLDRNASFTDTTECVSAQISEALIHRRYPIENIERDLSRLGAALYSVSVNVITGGAKACYAGIEAQGIGLNTGPIDDLSIVITDKHEDGAMVVELQGNPSLYEEWELRAYTQSLKHVIEQICEDPAIRLSKLSLSKRPFSVRDDVSNVLRPARISLQEMLLHGLEKAERDSTAIQFGERLVSYGELDDRSSALADRLKEIGVSRDTVVGILLERTPELLVAVMAVIKSEGAFLPIDPATPQRRLDFLLDNSAAVAVVTLLESVSLIGGRRIPVVCCDEQDEADRRAVQSVERCTAEDGAALAYVLYTSGSTGSPKGVMIQRESLVNVLQYFSNILSIRPKLTRIAATTNVTFDIAVLEWLLPLVNGAQCIMFSRDITRNGPALLYALKEYDVDVLQGTPSLWQMLLSSGVLPEKITALCGGETMSSRLAQMLTAQCAEVWNLYGPTEATIWSLAKRVSKGSEPTIGTPIPGVSCRVVDEYLEELPEGVTGELLIGGVGVSRGYAGRPDLTQEKFVADIAGFDGSAYRTGDYVRRRSDGDFEFVGRRDNQIKIRGHRIELGEIERCLGEVHSVTECAVVAIESGLVVAFIRGMDAPTEQEIREELSRWLPAYMIPSSYRYVTEWSLTPSGKIDRNALKRIIEAAPEIHNVRRSDDTTMSRLLGVARSILERDRIEPDDNFFELGGHSLLALELSLALSHEMGIDVDVNTIFRCATFRELSLLMDEGNDVEQLDRDDD